jgi:RNA polymerase sigma factor (sigma-70 family)
VQRDETGRTMTDSELIDAIRRGADGAVREFLTRFAPLLRGYAARMRLPGEDADVVIAEVLEDAVMRFVRTPRARRPRSLATYLVVCFRNRVLDIARHTAAADARIGAMALDELGGCSEATIKSARSTDGDSEPRTAISPTLLQLARVLESALTADERTMLVWIGESVAQREIAHWMNVTPAALRKRVERLRAKLRVVAATHQRESTAAVQAELRRFFARCGNADIGDCHSGILKDVGASSNGRPAQYDGRNLEVGYDERAQ